MIKNTTDAGHGGGDSGCVFRENGKLIMEKDIALSIERYCSLYLNNNTNKKVVNSRTRTSDVSTTLTSRSDLANNLKSKSFASIHINDAKNPEANGLETLYNPNKPRSKELAQCIHKRVWETGLFRTDRGLKARTNLSVLNRTNMPQALAELGFIKDSRDRAAITNPTNQKILGEAIAKGILDFHKIEVQDKPELNIPEENKEWLEVKDTNIKIDGKNRILAGGRIAGETYIKLRDIADLLGFIVGYEKDSDTPTIDFNKVDILLNGNKEELQNLKINNENFVKIRDAYEKDGKAVEWDNKEKLIVVE